MRCRHFTLRLTTQHAADDEAHLNEFMQSVHVHSVQSTPGTPGLWSVLIFYDEPASKDTQAARRTSRGNVPDPAGVTPTSDSAISAAGNGELTPEQQRIYERLREWRAQRAAEEGKPPYVIAHNAVLKEIARRHMGLLAVDDLLAISQLGPARTSRYGPDIIALLARLGSNEGALLCDDEC